MFSRLLAATIAVAAAVAAAAPGAAAELPRFAALGADEANLRAGPGTRYPVEWVFLKRGLPVEITAEYGAWRKIRDADGVEGWVHKSLLTGRRRVMVAGAVRTLRRDPAADAPPVARAEPGVLGRLLACDGAWCRVEIAGHEGWIRRAEVWGVYADEAVD